MCRFGSDTKVNNSLCRITAMGHRHLFSSSQMFENENDQGWDHGDQPYMHLGIKLPLL